MTETSINEKVLGVTPDMAPQDAVHAAYCTLIGEQISLEQLNQQVERFSTAPPEDFDITDIEREIAFGSLCFSLISRERRYSNPYFNWPLYADLMDRHGEPSHGPALMLGSISPLSSRAFTVLAKEVYGASSAHVVDIQGGRDKSRHGHFVFGDVLHLPYKSGSMHHVHVDQLLHMLEDTQQPYSSDKVRATQLLGEIHRVLADGGQLWMKEAPVNQDVSSLAQAKREGQELGRFIERTLSRLGMARCVIDPVTLPETTYSWSDPAYQDRRVVNECGAVAVYAQK